jgi:hypothetical protein
MDWKIQTPDMLIRSLCILCYYDVSVSGNLVSIMYEFGSAVI